MNIEFEPSWWTPLTWPRYGRKHQLIAVAFVALLFLFGYGVYLLPKNPLLGAILITLALVIHVTAGGILLSIEVYADSRE